MSGILGLLNPKTIFNNNNNNNNNSNKSRDINSSVILKRKELSNKQSLEKYAAIHNNITEAYKRWVERMKDSRARKIVYNVKKFVTEFNNKKSNNLDFNEDGRHTKKLHIFLSETFRSMCKNDVWCNLEKEELEKTFESLERYVMVKLYATLFPNSVNAQQRDEKLLEKIELLQFVKSEHLDIPHAFMNNDIVNKASDELCRMDIFRAPCDKIICLLNCCKIIMDHLKCFRSPASSPPSTSPNLKDQRKKPIIEDNNIKLEAIIHTNNINNNNDNDKIKDILINEEEEEEEEEEEKQQQQIKDKKKSNLDRTELDRPPSLDDFLPILIYVLLKANVPHLYLNVQYILHCRSPSQLKGEPWYYLTNLCSAISFIENLDHTHLSISQEEYEQYYNEAKMERDKLLKEAELIQLNAVEDSIQPIKLDTKDEIKEEEEEDLEAKKEASLREKFEFLQAKVVDLRFGDIPKLLQDYKRLANTLLIMQRQSPKSEDGNTLDIEDIMLNADNDELNRQASLESLGFWEAVI